MCCKIYFKTVIKMLANSRHKRYNDFIHTPYHIYVMGFLYNLVYFFS